MPAVDYLAGEGVRVPEGGEGVADGGEIGQTAAYEGGVDRRAVGEGKLGGGGDGYAEWRGCAGILGE